MMSYYFCHEQRAAADSAMTPRHAAAVTLSASAMLAATPLPPFSPAFRFHIS